MAWWQVALILLAIAWALQSIGVWVQMRHFQAIFSDMRNQWTDGELGAGASPGRFGQGVIALVSVSPSGDVRAVKTMRGRTVFAKFEDVPGLAGLSVADLRARIENGDIAKGLGIAIGKALEQIDKVKSERGGVSKNAPAIAAI